MAQSLGHRQQRNGEGRNQPRQRNERLVVLLQQGYTFIQGAPFEPFIGSYCVTPMHTHLARRNHVWSGACANLHCPVCIGHRERPITHQHATTREPRQRSTQHRVYELRYRTNQITR